MIKLIEHNFHRNIPNKKGVYIIISVDENNDPININRLFNSDKNGFLYIGQSSDLKNRLRMLYRVLHPEKYKATAHTFGLKYNKLPSEIKNKYPLDSLRVILSLDGNAEDVETKKLTEYFNKYGEVPPLNSSVNLKLR